MKYHIGVLTEQFTQRFSIQGMESDIDSITTSGSKWCSGVRFIRQSHSILHRYSVGSMLFLYNVFMTVFAKQKEAVVVPATENVEVTS